ncbi:WD repeat and SOCS box-containing protein 2 [Sciurus carolinensis]|uniref:WD repeat and SOCS box-containing protein 2 n=1 Tax=Sciurus carolinensis TaxID=30640 RepID=A0AA41N6W6_SCICA|nr:WD repeat and SOCS box-containing protein 2 [Sciurus carolinensis]
MELSQRGGPHSLDLPLTELEAVVVGEVNENVTLHCGNTSGPRGPVTWYRNNSEPVFLLSSDPSLQPVEPRFSLVNGSSLHIGVLGLQDEGGYTCHEGLNGTRRFPVQLKVASGPDQIEVNISAAGWLPNGTRYTARGSQVDFSCSSGSQPPPMVEWSFHTPSGSESFGKNLTVNCFTLLLMSPNLQGNYTCVAKNLLSGRQREVTTELLVYWSPPSVPRCSAEMPSGSFALKLRCGWDGGYPRPTFLWTEEPGGAVVGKSELGVELLNLSRLSDGKTFKCLGSHIVGPESGASCVVQIRGPSVLSEPMKTCFVGGNVTLTCQVTGAYPFAKIQWLRNLSQPEVVIHPDSHYLITQNGQSSTLTVQNCSRDLDEGYYVCRAENPAGVRAVDIWLSVKEPLNIGGIVGTIVSLLLLGLALVSGLILYYSPVFCWKEEPLLLAELKPGRPHQFDWKSSCETWSVAFSPDGSWFAWSQGHCIVKLIPWPLEEQFIPKGFEAKSRSSKNDTKGRGSPKEKTLDCGLNDGQIKIWEVQTGLLLLNLSGHQDVVRDLSFTPSGSLILVSASRDKTLRIWDLNKHGKQIQVLSGHLQWVYCCSISPDCSMLCSAAGEKSVFLWSMRSYTLIRKLEGHQSSVVSCDFSPDSALLVTASYDTNVIMWDPYTGERLRSLHHTQLEPAMDDSDVHMSSLRSVCFSPEGLYLATVADDRLLRIWALELKAPVAFAPMTNGLCCTFFPHGGVIATGTRDGHVQFWTAPRVLSSLKHLCRKALRSFLTTYQVLALPIPKKMKEFLTYRTF